MTAGRGRRAAGPGAPGADEAGGDRADATDRADAADRPDATDRADAADRSHPPTAPLLVVQIDGLSRFALERALRDGRLPLLRRLLDDRSHALYGWLAGLPSQTSSSQAGLLFGDDLGIPAFRWYEKDAGRLMVSNHPADAAEIERRAAPDQGLLEHGGSSVGNLLSGRAPRSTLTMSTLEDPTRRSEANALLTSPRFWARELALMAAEVRREVGESVRARAERRRPRVDRGGSFPFLRAVATVLLRDLTARVVAADLRERVPAIYVDFVGYDEVAHRAGPVTGDAFDVLERLDRPLARLLRAARASGYDTVVLSDHGQSAGAPFRQRGNETLEQVVAGLTGGDVTRGPGTTESWGYLNRVLSELTGVEHAVGAVWRVLLRPRRADGFVETGPDRRSQRGVGGETVVCASGNLGHIYLTNLDGRADGARIREAYPRLLDGLARHPTIDFVLLRDTGRPAVVGAAGRRWLDSGEVEGSDPLAKFVTGAGSNALGGPGVVDRLRTLDGLPHAGDLILNGGFDPSDGSVAAFEELVGSHGGLGGHQMEPFLLAPASWEVPERLDGPASVNALLRAHLSTAATAGAAAPATTAVR